MQLSNSLWMCSGSVNTKSSIVLYLFDSQYSGKENLPRDQGDLLLGEAKYSRRDEQVSVPTREVPFKKMKGELSAYVSTRQNVLRVQSILY